MLFYLIVGSLAAAGIIKFNVPSQLYFSNSLVHETPNAHCNTPVHSICKFHEEPSFLARTEEEIDRQCRLLTQHLDCLRDYTTSCGAHKVPFQEAKLLEAEKLVEDGCNKNSSLHLGIVQHADCVGEMHSNSDLTQTCSEYSRNKTEMLSQFEWNNQVAANSNLTTDNTEYRATTNCISAHLFGVCVASEVSKTCGSDAEKVVLEIVNRKKSFHDDCESASEEITNELIRALDMKSEDERILRAIIVTN